MRRRGPASYGRRQDSRHHETGGHQSGCRRYAIQDGRRGGQAREAILPRIVSLSLTRREKLLKAGQRNADSREGFAVPVARNT